MSVDLQGILNQYGNLPEIRNEMYAYTVASQINRCPLVTRLRRKPVGSVNFKIVKRNFRQRTAVVATGGYNSSTTTVTVNDGSYMMNGDVWLTPNGERLEIMADPTPGTPWSLTVRRSAEGTAASAGLAADVWTLMGNSRTGAEVNQNGAAFLPTAVDQYCQTFQHPVQIGGSLAASSAFVLPNGVPDVMALVKQEGNQNMMDDFEKTSFYGLGEAPGQDTASGGTNGRPKQKGLITLIATNNTSAPTNAGAYKPSDFTRDVLASARANGGEPSVALVSMGFMVGLQTWGMPLVRINAGATVLGTAIDAFECPFLSGVKLVFCYHLGSTGNDAAVGLTADEVGLRMMRNEFFNPRGVRGDAFEGDWMAEGAVELENEQHHSWTSGITAFSAT